MMLKKKFFLLLVPFFITAYAPAQTVKVKKEKSTVKGESMDGFSVDLQGTLSEVTKSFSAFTKTLGKIKQTDIIVIAQPNISGFAFAHPVYGITRENGKSATAWIGFNLSVSSKEDADKLSKELEKLMYDFGVKFYRDKIQVQIDESVRATQAVEKQQQRLVYENKSLGTKLEDNKREKIQLEKSLENNKLENQTLLKKIEQNKKAQDSVAVAAEQIRKMVEVHKQRQKKVN